VSAGHPASIVVQRRIEWPDTDAAGHYHYSTVFRLAEAAEAALQRRLGIDITQTFGRTPRVRVRADFESVLRFNDVVDVELAVAAVGSSSVAYRFEIRRGNGRAAFGEVVTVLLDRAGGRAQAWPPAWRELLLSGGPQPAERLVER